MKHLRATIFIVAMGAVSPAEASPDGQPANLRTSDNALVQYIKRTDFVFRAVLEQCSDEKIKRFTRDNLHYFTYTGNCIIRPRPTEDCQRYRVTATGTVDTAQSATVRDSRLELQCSA